MPFNKQIWILIAALVRVSCGVKKKVQPTGPEQASSNLWHTCLIQGARATIITDEDRLSATVTMQTVRDSMLVISVMPLLGMEMFRIEATPLEFIAIDKLHGQYTKATYAMLNEQLTPDVNWDILQQLCTAELPTGNEKARLQFMYGKESLELIVDYVPRQVDVPVRVMHQRLDRYTEVDPSAIL